MILAGGMFTAAPLRMYEKLLIAVVTSSAGSPLKKLTGVGFGRVNENDQVSLGALQLVIGAPVPQIPLPEIVVESALAVAGPKVMITNAIKSEDS